MTPTQCRAARALAGLSQAQLAKEADVALATVAAFEQGVRQPYRRTLAALVAVLEAHRVKVTADGVRTE